jgi:hypothetical protein
VEHFLINTSLCEQRSIRLSAWISNIIVLAKQTDCSFLCFSKELNQRKEPPDNFSTEFMFAYVLSLELLVQACVGPSDF